MHIFTSLPTVEKIVSEVTKMYNYSLNNELRAKCEGVHFFSSPTVHLSTSELCDDIRSFKSNLIVPKLCAVPILRL